jgi:hypothetical protein
MTSALLPRLARHTAGVALQCTAALALWHVAAAAQATAQPAVPQPPVAQASGRGAMARLSVAEFAALSARLSDSGGYFDTDNLISNERSLLHPLTTLEQRGVRGGVYVGVGPDQNFSYIAQVAPRMAFIIDIRRDNLLHHLLFKALFTDADSRGDFLARWIGRPLPPPSLRSAPIDSLLAWAQRTPPTEASSAAARQLVRDRVRTFGIPLTPTDLATIDRFHGSFIADGVALRFTSAGRAPQWYYPTLAQLLAERDLSGRQSSYLASDAAFRVVQSMQREHRIVPVVGDLAGAVLGKVSTVLRARGEGLSVLYTSNVEDYLIRDGRHPTFVRGLRTMPRQANAVVIRSWFGGEGSHPLNVPGYHTTQLVEPVATFVGDRSVEQVRRYRDLVTRVRD